LLGGSIVEQILSQANVSVGHESVGVLAHKGPQPPAKHAPEKSPSPPQPPSGQPLKSPSPPQPPSGQPLKSPTPPSHAPLKSPSPPQPPSGPQGVSHVFQTNSARQPSRLESVGVLDLPGRAQCIVLDEFLAPQELEELISFTLQHENDFQSSQVVAATGQAGMVDYSHRRSRVLVNLGKHEQVVVERIRGVLPSILEQLGMPKFPVTQTEAQITASNDGDFFGAHSDDSHEMIASRRLTFVYFFHREPRQFEGGELRLYGPEGNSRAESHQAITPQQNQIVFFPCSVTHEITTVECPSQAFADSRFTLNGWLHN
jgi:SM-20-related protein